MPRQRIGDEAHVKRSRLARRRVCIRLATAAGCSSAGSSVTIIGVSSVQTGPPDAGMRRRRAAVPQTAVVTRRQPAPCRPPVWHGSRAPAAASRRHTETPDRQHQHGDQRRPAGFRARFRAARGIAPGPRRRHAEWQQRQRADHRPAVPLAATPARLRRCRRSAAEGARERAEKRHNTPEDEQAQHRAALLRPLRQWLDQQAAEQ